MSIICKQCGTENPDGSEMCSFCFEPLSNTLVQDVQSFMAEEELAKNVGEFVNEAKSAISELHKPQDSGKRYFAFCENSKTRTPISGPDVLKFYCNDCKKEHTIDDFMFRIEVDEETTSQADDSPSPKAVISKNSVILEEVVTHATIEISKPGGTIGRYGTFGSEFFLSRNMRTISGEHCRISFKDEEWILEHLSKTNDTEYDQMKLDHNEEVVLSEGKIITLSKLISFYVRFK